MSVDVVQIAQNIACNCVYPVFPCAQNKQPAIPGDGGFKHASTDPAEIARLWRRHPGPLIGVPTGAISGFDVLDIDAGQCADDAAPKVIEKREAARAWWYANSDRIPSSRAYETGSGGIHVYFRHVPGITNTQGRINLGVDSRGDGGYVIYWFGAGRECFDHSPIADWPSWLLQAMAPKMPTQIGTQRRNPSSVEDVITRAIRCVGHAQEGTKHEAVRKAARLLGGIQSSAGFSDIQAVSWLSDVLPTSTVKDWRNVERTALWGLDRGRQEPISIGGVK